MQRIGFSFSGAGWLIPFHFGAAHLLKSAGCLKPRNTMLAGSSGGAIVAAVAFAGADLVYCFEETMRLQRQMGKSSLGPIGSTEQLLREMLPDVLQDTEEEFGPLAEAARNHLFLCVTEVRSSSVLGRMMGFPAESTGPDLSSDWWRNHPNGERGPNSPSDTTISRLTGATVGAVLQTMTLAGLAFGRGANKETTERSKQVDASAWSHQQEHDAAIGAAAAEQVEAGGEDKTPMGVAGRGARIPALGGSLSLERKLHSKFRDLPHVVEAVVASSHIPLYSSPSPWVVMDGIPSLDGGIVDMAPCIPRTRYTVKVSPIPPSAIWGGFDLAPAVSDVGKGYLTPRELVREGFVPSGDESIGQKLFDAGCRFTERFLEQHQAQILRQMELDEKHPPVQQDWQPGDLPPWRETDTEALISAQDVVKHIWHGHETLEEAREHLRREQRAA